MKLEHEGVSGRWGGITASNEYADGIGARLRPKILPMTGCPDLVARPRQIKSVLGHDAPIIDRLHDKKLDKRAHLA